MHKLDLEKNVIVQNFISQLNDTKLIPANKLNKTMDDYKLVDKVLDSIGIRSGPITLFNFRKPYANPTQALRIHTALYSYIKMKLFNKYGGSRCRSRRNKRLYKKRTNKKR